MLLSRRATEVPYGEIRWLWPGWIPLAAATFVEGDPGLGKSTALCSLAAIVSRGHETFPFQDDESLPISGYIDGEPLRRLPSPGTVVMLSLEDDSAAVLKPRLDACGANMENVYVVEGALPEGASYSRDPLIPDDIDDLRGLIREINSMEHQAPVKLLTVDPLMAYIPGDVNTWNDVEVRQAVRPLIRLAEEEGFAVVFGRHLSKASKGKGGVSAGLGSIGFSAAARSVIAVQTVKGATPTEGDPEWCEWKLVKSNYSKTGRSLYFRVWLGDDGGQFTEWAEKLPEERVRVEAEPLDPLEALIRRELEDGPRLAREMFEAAERAGLSADKMKRVRVDIGVVSRQTADGWVWEWPGA